MTRIEQLGVAAALHRQGRLAEAEEAYGALLRANPNDADALHLTGLIAYQRGDYDRAIKLIDRAIRRGGAPSYFHSNIGAAYRAKGQLGEAVKQFRIALKLDSRSHDAHNNLGNVLQLMGDTEGALRHFRKAIELGSAGSAWSNLLYTLNLASDIAAEEVAREHRAWGDAQPAPPNEPYLQDRDPERRLRVGYVSSDFRTHSVTFFLAPLFEAHDRDAVEILCYSSGVRVDATTERLRALASAWSEIAGQSDDDVAALVRRDRVDVLVDLAGHTSGHRLGVFARAPAPVQVTWLGYPNTTGLRAMGYRITDARVDPPDPDARADALHTETLVRLEHGFLCYEPWADSPEVVPLPAEGAGKIAFGSFNNLAKVGVEALDRWSRVLRSVEGSVLVLKASPLADSGVRAQILARLKDRGIANRRVRLLPEEPTVRGHLARYGEIDIALDSFPYCGTTTTFEALWMGVPVVTLEGEVHASRVGADILSRVGLDACIATNADEYVAIASRLASDVPALAELRRTLRERLRASSLCDRAQFARELEGALRMMWRRFCAG